MALFLVVLPSINNYKIYIRMNIRHLLIIVGLFGAIAANAQQKMLLTDPQVKIDATNAVNALYNFKFEKADRDFRWLKFKYPEHPMPYFLLGLAEWWKIMPNPNDEAHDDAFFAYMDTTIAKAEVMLDESKTSKNVEACFFLSAAHGFKGRLHSERHNWSRATNAGRNALNYLQKNREDSAATFGSEFLFGDALFNYYAVWIHDNYRWLRPVLSFFPKGNKELGISQLETVARNAFYTRVEAQYYLARIYYNDENHPEKALPILEYLAATFPDNAYFQRLYARITYSQGHIDKCEKTSLDILDKIQKKMPGYESTSGRYASFFLGYIFKYRYHNAAKSKEYFQKAIDFAKDTKSTETGYYLYALQYLGQAAEEEKNYSLAREYYETIKDDADSDHECYKFAKKKLKELKRK